MTYELFEIIMAAASLVLLWTLGGAWGKLVVVGVDLFGAMVLSIPRGLTISTYVGLVRSNSVTTKFAWQRPMAVALANVLDKIQTNHCAMAKASDHAAAQTALDLTK